MLANGSSAKSRAARIFLSAASSRRLARRIAPRQERRVHGLHSLFCGFVEREQLRLPFGRTHLVNEAIAGDAIEPCQEGFLRVEAPEMRDGRDKDVLRQILGDLVVVRAPPEVPKHLGAMEANCGVGEIHLLVFTSGRV